MTVAERDSIEMNVVRTSRLNAMSKANLKLLTAPLDGLPRAPVGRRLEDERVMAAMPFTLQSPRKDPMEDTVLKVLKLSRPVLGKKGTGPQCGEAEFNLLREISILRKLRDSHGVVRLLDWGKSNDVVCHRRMKAAAEDRRTRLLREHRNNWKMATTDQQIIVPVSCSLTWWDRAHNWYFGRRLRIAFS